MGILELLAAIALLAAAGWLYTKVWGTALLYTDSSLGKVAGYYWILLIPAVALLVLGIITFKKRTAVSEEAVEETQAAEEPPAVKEESVAEIVSATTTESTATAEPTADGASAAEQEQCTEDKCPNCGAPINKGNKFCINCGHKLM